MVYKDIIMIIAIIVGPIAAVQIQKILELRRNKKEKRMAIFKVLMTTRATRVSVEHVQALNMIDIEFNGKGYEKVVDTWRNYQDHLTNGNPKLEIWAQKNDDLFIELLFEMGKALGYKFDKVMLKRAAYFPYAHGDTENNEIAIRSGLAKILSGETALPVFFTNSTDATVEKQPTTNTDTPISDVTNERVS